jgi:hypothetical protein
MTKLHALTVYSYVQYRVPYPATQLLTSKSKNSEQNINTKKGAPQYPTFSKAIMWKVILENDFASKTKLSVRIVE